MRVDSYARRIRKLTVATGLVDMAVLRAFSDHRGRETLFPRLVDLSWSYHVDKDFCPPPRNLCPPWVPFGSCWNVYESEQPLDPYPACLPFLSPGLKRLELKMTQTVDIEAILRDIHQPVEPSPRTTERIADGGLCTIASLPCLNFLRLRVPFRKASAYSLTDPHSSRSVELTHLKTLKMDADGFGDSYSRFLKRFPPSHLEELYVTRGAVYHLQSFFQTVSSIVSHKTLRRIQIINRPLPTEVGIIDLNTLRPLFSFQKLETLDICSDLHRVCLDDNSFEVLAAAWPLLSSIRIIKRLGPTSEMPIATIKTLAILVHHCPRLCDIELDFDASLIPQDRPGRANYLIQTLRVQLRHNTVKYPYC